MGKFLIKTGEDEYIWFSTVADCPITPPLSSKDMYETMVDYRTEEIEQETLREIEKAKSYVPPEETRMIYNTPGLGETDGEYKYSDLARVAQIMYECDNGVSSKKEKKFIKELKSLRVDVPYHKREEK